MIRNSTFNVSSFFHCQYIEVYTHKYEHDPMWRQTYAGCLILRMLQDMYKFNVNYVNTTTEQILHPDLNNYVDIYVRPMTMNKRYWEFAFPVHSVFEWRFGFLLRYKQKKILQTFYSLPFTPRVWCCIIVILFLSSLIFYILSYWEKRIIGGECSYCHELLLAFSAFCQHILPLQANLCSRRIAYLFFILCSYVIHCFYTSNLLSHIVNDNDRAMDLQALARSDYELAIIQDTLRANRPNPHIIRMDKNLSLISKKMDNVKIMNVSSALEALEGTKTAVLSDYTSLYPIIKRSLDKDAICDLIEVDLYSMVKKYFYTSKQFPFKDEFKIGILKAKETGLVRRMLLKSQHAFSCNDHERSYTDYTIIPLIILLASFVITFCILFGEILYYKHYDKIKLLYK